MASSSASATRGHDSSFENSPISCKAEDMSIRQKRKPGDWSYGVFWRLSARHRISRATDIRYLLNRTAGPSQNLHRLDGLRRESRRNCEGLPTRMYCATRVVPLTRVPRLPARTARPDRSPACGACDTLCVRGYENSGEVEGGAKFGRDCSGGWCASQHLREHISRFRRVRRVSTFFSSVQNSKLPVDSSRR